jgi:hypothetical protein
LDKGASRGICLNPIKVTQIIQQHKNKITEKSMQILEVFIKLVKINPFIAKKCFRRQYLIQLEKLIDYRFESKELTKIGKTISNSTFETEDKISTAVRRKYL